MDQRTIRQYELIERIGAGGMGEIYKARDMRLNRFVAIKALSAGMAADPARRIRFVQEAQAVSALNHPNIITIYDIVNDADTHYMVIEYVDGKTLLELIPQGGLPVREVIRYASQIAEALCAAHATGIIHRDLKPANVMVTSAGLVKVLDFGLAKLVDWGPTNPDGTTVTLMPAPLTVEGTLLGTVNYMSPEQAEGKRIDARSDIFSFGAMLYEMLTGQSAFRGESVISTLSAVLRDDIRPLRELAPAVPQELESIVVACLKKDPNERVQSMQEVQAALVALKQRLDSGVFPGQPTATRTTHFPPPVRRSAPFATGAISALVLVGIAAGGGYWWIERQHSGSSPNHSQTSAPAGSPINSGGALTNNDIVTMATEKVATEVIISRIRTTKTNFDLSTGEVVRLTQAGVPPAVIQVMGNPGQSETVVTGSSPPQPPPSPSSVPLTDGMPVLLVLADDIPSTAAAGDPLRFKVAANVSVDDAIAIHKGAVATGTIADAPKRVFGIGGKMMFTLDQVDAVDGQKVPLRVTPIKSAGISKRPVDTGAKKPKEVMAIAGTAYTAYIDGAKTVTIRK